MTARFLLTAVGCMGMLFGLAFLLIPHVIAPILMRNVADSSALKATLAGTAIGNALGAFVAVFAVMTGVENALGWSSALIFAAFCGGGLYCLARGVTRR